MENTENNIAENKPYAPVEVNLTSLLEAGAHFGHKKERWCPKMMPYIFGMKNVVHVINLDKTLEHWAKVRDAVRNCAVQGKSFLFVGTKQQAREVIKSAAERARAHHVNNRWLGGMLTNFHTIKKSINRMEKMENLLKEAAMPDTKIKIAKKEKLQISRDLEKLAINLSGIRGMKQTPDMVFVVDVRKDEIAVNEARRLHIPVVALVDTNTDPSMIDFPIPCNDDSRGSIELFVNAIADALIEGAKEYEVYAAIQAAKDREGGAPRGGRRGGKRREDKKAEKGEAIETVAAAEPTAN